LVAHIKSHVMKKTISLLFFVLISFSLAAQNANDSVSKAPLIVPSSTHLFAQKDGQDLYLSVYQPSEGSQTEVYGKEKPTIVFFFGGGFTHGARDEVFYHQWYKLLCDNGYRLVTVDYRLGMKGVKASGIKFVKKIDAAIQMATDDLFSATLYLVEHGGELGIDPSNLVLAGSSAGAIASLQGEWELCNRHEAAVALPEGFQYAGVISYSGAIFSKQGKIRYRDMAPCPHLMFHGTADKIVNYKQTALLNIHFAGTDAISRTFIKNGYVYRIYRFEGNSHEIANSMVRLLPETLEFLETNVIRQQKKRSDALISDPSIPIPEWASKGAKSLY